jgi:reactive intermediate/imine deaminase
MNRLSVARGLVVLLALMGVGETLAAEGPRFLNAEGREDDLPYSHAVLAGDTLYLAGMIGIDPATGRAPAEVDREIKIVMETMKKRLALAGLSMDDLISVQVFCSDLSLYDQFNALYRSYFKNHFPARAFIGSAPLLRGGRFELTGIAVRR